MIFSCEGRPSSGSPQAPDRDLGFRLGDALSALRSGQVPVWAPGRVCGSESPRLRWSSRETAEAECQPGRGGARRGPDVASLRPCSPRRTGGTGGRAGWARPRPFFLGAGTVWAHSSPRAIRPGDRPGPAASGLPSSGPGRPERGPGRRRPVAQVFRISAPVWAFSARAVPKGRLRLLLSSQVTLVTFLDLCWRCRLLIWCNFVTSASSDIWFGKRLTTLGLFFFLPLRFMTTYLLQLNFIWFPKLLLLLSQLTLTWESTQGVNKRNSLARSTFMLFIWWEKRETPLLNFPVNFWITSALIITRHRGQKKNVLFISFHKSEGKVAHNLPLSAFATKTF